MTHYENKSSKELRAGMGEGVGHYYDMGNKGEIVIFQSPDGVTNLEVKLEEETIWLTQQQMVELYHSSKANVSEHIKHIFEDGELMQGEVVRKFRTTAADGKSYNVAYYNLDMIIALGYRIKSIVATRFRQWANRVLKDYLTKGFAVNEKLRQENLVELRQLVRLVGRTLMIAESRPEEKDVMVKVVVNLINKNNQ